MNTRIALAPVFAAALLAAGASAFAAEQTWRMQNGTVTLSLYRQLIKGSGIDLVDLRQTATPRGDMEEAVGFAIAGSTNLEFEVLGGAYRHWNSGGVTVNGGFTLRGPNGSLSMQNFTVVYRETGTHDNLFLVGGSDPNAPADFDVSHIKVMFDRNSRTMLFGYADLIISARGAKTLGRPDLTGQIIGMVSVGGTAKFVAGDPKDPDIVNQGGGTDGGNSNGDVMLFTLGSCASAGRVGAWPNGISGLGLSTTSCNVSVITGDNVNWYVQMDERHPVIAQNFYRKRTVAGAGTRLEQVGIGWVKHGFLSTNSNDCGSCQWPGGSHLLGVNCSDTYGALLNADRNWLGPRNEVNPFTGRWECTGSYFANYQPDCIERFNPNGLDGVAHRLQVRDQDMELAGNPQFYYEAYYVSENDLNRYNNAAWRPVDPTWNAGQSKYNFTPLASQTQGVLVDTWGDLQPAPRMAPASEGDLLVAVEVTDMGGGNFHYEYTVYNHTSQREARTFSVPLPQGANVSNIEFRDTDWDADNDWRATVENGAITWATETYAANQNANSLKWGTLYNFRFDANVPPAEGHTGAQLFRPGTLLSNVALSRVPRTGQAIAGSMTVLRGNKLMGEYPDLAFSDDSRVQIRPGVVLTSDEAPIRVQVEGTAAIPNPASMTFRYEGHATDAAVTRTIEAFNFSTNQWVVVNAGASTTSDSVTNVVINNPAQFIQAVTRTVRVRISYKPSGPTLLYPYTVRIDQGTWIVQ